MQFVDVSGHAVLPVDLVGTWCRLHCHEFIDKSMAHSFRLPDTPREGAVKEPIQSVQRDGVASGYACLIPHHIDDRGDPATALRLRRNPLKIEAHKSSERFERRLLLLGARAERTDRHSTEVIHPRSRDGL